MESGAASTTISSKIAEAFNLEGVLNKGAVHPGGDLTFYNYEGSLTAPPCTEGVDWYVSADAVEATREEIKHITESVYASESTSTGNNRATQPLNSRKVLVAHTGFQHHIKHHGHKADAAAQFAQGSCCTHGLPAPHQAPRTQGRRSRSIRARFLLHTRASSTTSS